MENFIILRARATRSSNALTSPDAVDVVLATLHDTLLDTQPQALVDEICQVTNALLHGTIALLDKLFVELPVASLVLLSITALCTFYTT